MRRSTSILGVLLGASLLANAMLAVRLSRTPDPEISLRKAAVSEKIAGRTEEAAATLRESLDAERRKVEELKAKVERLETDKKVLAQEVPGAGKADKLAAFKGKLRKLFKLSKDQTGKAGQLDPDSMVEATEVVMEFMKIAATRSKDPRGYADYLQAFYEVGLEGEGTAMNEAQAAALNKLFQDMGQDLAKIPATPAGEKLLKEIEIESAAMARVNTLFTEQQREALGKGQMTSMTTGNMLSTTYVMKNMAVDTISQTWTAAYQLEATQLPQAKAAAKAYVDAMNRFDAETKGKGFSFEQQGTAQHYDYRLRSVREQMAALQMLQASMTPAQQERVRTQAMREILVIDPNAIGESADVISVPADK